MKTRKTGLLFGIICLLGFAILAYFGISEIKTLEYPEVEVTVYDVEVDEQYDSDSGSYDYTYTALVSYTIDGQDYKSTISTDSDCKAGDVQTVRYNPNNKLDLHNSGTSSFIIMGICGTLLLILGIGLLIGYFKTAKVVKENAKPDGSLPDNLRFS